MYNKYLLIIFLIVSCNNYTDERLQISNYGNAQGTTYSIKYHNENGENFQYEIDSIFNQVDISLSTYIKNSTISKINNNISNKTDSLFNEVFNQSQKIFEITNGHFDPTISPLMKFWGFKDEQGNISEIERIKLMSNIGFEKIQLKGNKIIKLNSKISLDFNGIAQGFTVDLISNFLDTKNIKNYMIEVGGEVKCKGLNYKNEVWKIGIQNPVDSSSNYYSIVKLQNISIATSGSYNNYKFDKETGQKYSHIINPKTGMPSSNKLISVTILNESCMRADAVSTACMVMGKTKSIDFLNSNPDYEGMLIYFDDNGKLENYSTNFFINQSKKVLK